MMFRPFPNNRGRNNNSVFHGCLNQQLPLAATCPIARLSTTYKPLYQHKSIVQWVKVGGHKHYKKDCALFVALNNLTVKGHALWQQLSKNTKLSWLIRRGT